MSLWSSRFQNVGWYKATTLSERIELRREKTASPSAEKFEVGTKRLRRWRSQAPFTDDFFFAAARSAGNQ
jgi:hypothetical protein